MISSCNCSRLFFSFRPTPDITTADKSTPAKLHETLQEKLHELNPI